MEYLTITEALKKLRAREISSVELTKLYLDRINEVDGQVKSYITVTADYALKMAKQADDKYANGETGPLLGVPFSLKDLYCTKGILTTAGSKILDNFYPPYSATVFQRLEKAGAVLLGKVNLDAFAHGSSTEASDFFVTGNPWDLSRLPGGSSGGSAASVAGGEAVFSVGSDTGGSVRGPAAWCGLVGLKPTYGLISRYGLIAMASSLDCPGPLTLSVADAALVTGVLAGRDDLDAVTSSETVPNYGENLKEPVKGLRVGLIKNYFLPEMEKGLEEKIMDAVENLRSLGVAIGEITLIDPRQAVATYTVIQRAEVSSNLARFDGIRFGRNRQSFGDEAKKRIMLGTYTLSAGYYDQYYAKAQNVRAAIVEDFNKAFSRFDVLIAPMMPTTALSKGARAQNEAMFGELMDILAEPASMAGLPSLAVPCGFLNNLPVSFQLIAPRLREDLLFRIGYAYQNVTDWHLRHPKEIK